MNLKTELAPDEVILKNSRGNLRQDSFNPFSWIGGSWFLTNKRLVFVSNLTNYQAKMESIYFEDITSIGMKHHDFLSSKLTIFLVNDSVVELHVKNRRLWINEISDAVNRYITQNKTISYDGFINSEIRKKPRGTTLKLIIYFVVIFIIATIIHFTLI
jgi:hypothetical protein